MYLRGTEGVIFVYDITDKDSLEILKKYSEMRNEYCSEASVMVLGNKCDMKVMRQVTSEEGMKFANSMNALFYETSAKTGENVEVAFSEFIKSILIKREFSIDSAVGTNGKFIELDNAKVNYKRVVVLEMK